MSQYIDKDALVAEIERRIKSTNNNVEIGAIESLTVLKTLNSLISFIETLEVKEVDLEKHIKEDIEDALFDLNGVAVKGATHYLTVEDVKNIAKHFFELGMQQSKNHNNNEE